MSQSSSSITLPALAENQRRFLETQRVAHLATADADRRPHVVPVCFAVSANRIYITIDDKPKQARSASLKRLRNIAENPAVALVVDHYDDDDWSRLGWVMVRGNAEILGTGAEHAAAQLLLRNRYPQMEAMALEKRHVIAIHIDRVTSWGDLSS
jgi:PPOX class probable F420-dependent enzyme